MLTAEKQQFLEFVFVNKILTFGDFTLKSGRKSPYFFNAGKLQTGESLKQLGQFYADYLIQNNLIPETVFGPAYKGIPIAVATAIAMANKGHNVGYCFDRKEAKTHGEGGIYVGQTPNNNMFVLDDVITAGTAVRGLILKLQEQQLKPLGLLVAIDRQENNTNNLPASQAIYDDFGIKVHSLINLADVLSYGLAKGYLQEQQVKAIQQHKAN